MGIFEYDQERRERFAAGRVDLHGIAAQLGGEVSGKYILMPSPGQPPDDRSCSIVFWSPVDFFVYDCEGPRGAAYRRVRQVLGFAGGGKSSPERNEARALQLLCETIPSVGTLVEVYLRSRHIIIRPPAVLRFHPSLFHSASGRRFPAMVAEVSAPDDRSSAVHRTYLGLDGRGKAPIEPNKMTLGPIRGAAIRLAPAAEELMVGEGIETCLAAMQETGKPAWSAISTAGLRQVNLPPLVRRVIILADGDPPGELAAQAAARRFAEEGREVRIAQAPAGMDFNDLLSKARR